MLQLVKRTTFHTKILYVIVRIKVFLFTTELFFMSYELCVANSVQVGLDLEFENRALTNFSPVCSAIKLYIYILKYLIGYSTKNMYLGF